MSKYFSSSIPSETQHFNPMEKSYKIIRKSIHTFLQNYQYFTSIVAFLILPYSASILLSQAFISSSLSSLLPTIYTRLKTLFDAAGFPPSSQFFTILNQKLSQTISSCLITLPFTLTFLLISKSFIIQSLNNNNNKKLNSSPPSLYSTLSIYYPILITYIYNSFLILSANATVFTLLLFAFNFLEGFYYSSTSLLILSASGAVLYSIVIANTLIICNLALVLSGIEKCSGYLAILKACVMIRGRTSTALSLALPLNLGLAAIESLFHYRIVTSYHKFGKFWSSLVLEGCFIAYLYAILVVLDTIVSYMFYRSMISKFGKIDSSELYDIKVVDHQEDLDSNDDGFGSWKSLGPLQLA